MTPSRPEAEPSSVPPPPSKKVRSSWSPRSRSPRFALPRLHLAEIEDQTWLSPILRGYLTDCLRFLFSFFLDRTPVVARLADLLERTGDRRLLDLCSGSSGPLARIVEDLAVEHGLEVTATLTDLYPNHECFETLQRESNGRLAGRSEPLDARSVPRELDGVRTLFAGLHHFRPPEARAILADAADAGQPIAAFEVSERHPRLLGVLPLLPFAVFAMTPFLRPRSASRFLLTYGLPLVPLFVLWDGLVSCLRTYTVAELEQLVHGLDATADGRRYRFEVGQDRVRGLPARVTWLLGWPEPRLDNSSP